MSKDSRQLYYKKAVSSDDGRAKRSTLSFGIRREKNEMKINKKRNISDQSQQQPQINEETLKICMTLAQQAQSEDRMTRYQAVQKIRQKLSIQNRPPIDEVIHSGLVPVLVKYLTFFDDQEIQLEAAWALTNIASGSTAQTYTVIEHGAVNNFIALLRSPKPQVREQAIWALGNIAGDNVQCRDLLLNAGILPPLLEQFKEPNTSLSLVKNATWTLSNLCRGKPQPNPILIEPALGVLATLINYQDKDILSDVAWALSYLSDGDKDSIQRVMDTPGVCAKLVELLRHENYLVQTPAIRAVGNFISGSDEQTKIILEHGALEVLITLLDHARPTIVNETCWTISNIAAGSPEQVGQLINTGVLSKIIELMTKNSFDIQKETAWCVFNLTSNLKFDIINYLVSINVIPALLDLLKIPDIELKEITLKSLDNILKVGKHIQIVSNMQDNPYVIAIIQANGTETIEELQDHTDEFIASKVRRMIETYFSHVVEGEDAPPENNNKMFMGFN